MKPGERFGPYDVLEVLGAGGMGVVYRAKDTRLNREVAVKTLAQAGAFDRVRLQRFEQEVQAASSLNHPNVVAVYDVGDEGGVPYLVTELLEGQTLRERMRQGRLAPRKAIEIGLQIAQGLAAVHARGIVHRDLKPENVFLTSDGRVKILDFGVSRADSVTPPSATLPLTQAGAVIGTAGYMAPEQVRGRPADTRSDLFALGTILFEMVTGSMAFGGDTPIERGYSILNSDPADPDSLGVSVPPALTRVIRRCLEKEPEERFQHARDLAFALEAITADSGTTPQLAPKPKRWRLRTVLLWAGVVAAVLSAYAIGTDTASEADATEKASSPVMTRLTFRGGLVTGARFTSDRRTVVYSGNFEDEPQTVFAGTIGSPHSRPVTPPNTRLLDVSNQDDVVFAGRTDPSNPGAFLASRMSLSGGAARQLFQNVIYVDHAPDGTQLVLRREGTRTTLEAPPGRVLLDTSDYVVRARFSPAGDRIAYERHPVVLHDRGFVEVIDREGKSVARSKEAWMLEGLAWHPKTEEVWFTASDSGPERRLHALSIRGEEREVLRVPGSLVLHDIDAEGRLLVVVGQARSRMYGKLFGASRERGLSLFDGSIPMDISADGDALLFHEGFGAGTNEVQTFLRRSTDSAPVLLAQGMGHALSPDKRWAAVAPRPPFNTLTLVPTGPGDPQQLPLAGVSAVLLVRFFPDGERLAISAIREDGKPRVYLQALPRGAEAPDPPKEVADADLQLDAAPPSPDGRTLAAIDAENRAVLVDVGTGKVTRLPGLEEHSAPIQWSKDGRELYLFVWRPAPRHLAIEIFRYDISTGAIRPVRTLTPPDPVGVEKLVEIMITPDGEQYVYRMRQKLETLYLIEGLR